MICPFGKKLLTACLSSCHLVQYHFINGDAFVVSYHFVKWHFIIINISSCQQKFVYGLDYFKFDMQTLWANLTGSHCYGFKSLD